MAIPPYTQGYPPDGASLGATKSTIRNNLDGTFLTLAVDHVNNNGVPATNPAGYHKVVHMVPQGTDPGAIAGYGQLYSKSVVNDPITDTALFWETATGLITQLTTNITPVASANGSTFIPGGIILQWGTVSATNSTNVTVTFPLQFPANCFNVQISRLHSSTSPGSTNSMWVNTTPSTTGFQIHNDDGHTWAYYWFAIGN